MKSASLQNASATDSPISYAGYAAANKQMWLNVEHRQHKRLNDRAENSHRPTRVREKLIRRFKSGRRLQQFASVP
jgi:putative transposase